LVGKGTFFRGRHYHKRDTATLATFKTKESDKELHTMSFQMGTKEHRKKANVRQKRFSVVFPVGLEENMSPPYIFYKLQPKTTCFQNFSKKKQIYYISFKNNY